MDEEERRRRAIEGLDAIRNPVTRLQLLEDMAEARRVERGNYPIEGECDTPCGYGLVDSSPQRYLTVPEIWEEIASVMR
jgi:hypothetical protein